MLTERKYDPQPNLIGNEETYAREVLKQISRQQYLEKRDKPFQFNAAGYVKRYGSLERRI